VRYLSPENRRDSRVIDCYLYPSVPRTIFSTRFWASRSWSRDNRLSSSDCGIMKNLMLMIPSGIQLRDLILFISGIPRLKSKYELFAALSPVSRSIDSLLACGCERIPAWHVWKLRHVLTWFKRGQCLPPFFSEISITRLRLWVPLPHPLSHRLHGLHSLTAQSTTTEGEWDPMLKIWPSGSFSWTSTIKLSLKSLPVRPNHFDKSIMEPSGKYRDL